MGATAPLSSPEADEDSRGERWLKLRQGSRNVAGVTWQLAVSVHVLVMSRAGKLPFTTLVPEGFEDLDCLTAAGDETLIQVKEVSAGAGKLETSRICQAIVHAMGATTGRIMILTDGDLNSGMEFSGWDESLAAPAERWTGLIELLRGHGLTTADAVAVLERVHLVRLPWNLREQTEALLSDSLGVHPTVASFAVNELYESFGRASADQRHLSLAQARSLTLGAVDATLHKVQSAVDVAGLDVAVETGVCRPANFSAASATSVGQFYLGVDGVPSHIAQGLDVIRHGEMGQITEAAQLEEYAVIVGPSGSGKSVLLWRAARDVILGARVIRVARVASDQDARLLVRHVELLRPTGTSPVVVAADNLGRPRTRAWPDAVAALRELRHVFIIGAAREEDFSPNLLDGGTRVIKPSLDRATADMIAERIERAGITLRMASGEAFARSNGLLMEYLSLLREGRRLEQVLAIQASQLAAPGREVQRQAARLVLAAHSVGLALTAQMLANALAHLAGGTSAVGDALSVLKNEHIVLANGKEWTGLHELRSQTLTALLHDAPPPTLGDTLSIVTRVLPADETGWLLRRTAERFPTAVLAVTEAAAVHVHEQDIAASEVAELLEGAERADNVLYAATYLRIVKDIAPPGVSPVLISPMIYGIRNQDLFFDPVGSLSFDEMINQLKRIARELPPRRSPVLGAIAKHLAPDLIARLIAAGTSADAVRLLEALAGTVPLSAPDAADVFRSFDEPTNPVQADIWARLIDALSPFVPEEERIATFGSVEHRAVLIAQAEPSAVVLTMQSDTDPSLTVLNGLSAQEEAWQMPWDVPSPAGNDALNKFVVALARRLFLACPEAAHVEIITITPSGRRFKAGGFEPGYKRMSRDAFKERTGVRRNVGFQGAIRMLSAASTWTALLAEQAQIARKLVDLAEGAPFRLRANDQAHQAKTWVEQVHAMNERAGELASKPTERPEARGTSHADEDNAQRQDDPVSKALNAASQALKNVVANSNRVAVAMALRDAAAKVEHARSLTPTYFGLDEPIPAALGPALERLARAASSAAADPNAWTSVRFGDQARIDAIAASSAAAARQQQYKILSVVNTAVPGAILRTVTDPSPFPSSIEQTAWLVAVELDDWNDAVEALASIAPEQRQSLNCNVWALALDGSRPLPLAVVLAHYGELGVLPLVGDALEQRLTSAGLALPRTIGAAAEKIRELTVEAARLSWTFALHRRRPADWPKLIPAPTSDDLTNIRADAHTAAVQLPAAVGPILEDALRTLVAQVELESYGSTALTLAGELQDAVDKGPTSVATEAGIWQALTALSLAPTLHLDTA